MGTAAGAGPLAEAGQGHLLLLRKGESIGCAPGGFLGNPEWHGMPWGGVLQPSPPRALRQHCGGGSLYSGQERAPWVLESLCPHHVLGAGLDSHSPRPVPSTAPSLDPFWDILFGTARDSLEILAPQQGEKIPWENVALGHWVCTSQGSSKVPSTLPQWP